jgi:hypothetical protein
VPFCLGLFNFGTLDDFSAFVDENNDYELFFDNNRWGASFDCCVVGLVDRSVFAILDKVAVAPLWLLGGAALVSDSC